MNCSKVVREMNEVWVMRDGTTIAIKDMSTSHLNNTIKMLERDVDNLKFKHAANAMSLARGELAMEAANGTAEFIYQMPTIEFLKEYTPYGSLVKELDFRKQ